MPVIVSGNAATRLTRAQKHAGNVATCSGTVSDACGDKEDHIGVLDTQILSAVTSGTYLTQDLHDGQHQTVDGVARDHHGRAFVGHDPDTEVVLNADGLGKLGLYNGSLVEVRIFRP
jgi:hypothetical protein